MNRTTRWIAPALAVLTLAGTVFAQNTRPEPPRKEPPLKGPAVKDGRVPGEYRSFGEGGKGGKDRMQQETPHRLFVRAFESVRGEGVEPAIRLSEEQDSRLGAIDRQFRDAIESYRKDHASEARELIAKLPPAERRKAADLLGGQGGPKRPLDGNKPRNGPKADKPDRDSDPMQAMDPKAAEDARARLKELLQGAPKPADTHVKMFAVLNEAQKPVVEKELERLKKETQGRREPGKIDKGLEKGKGSVKNKPGADAKPLTLNDPRIPERMRERIKSLPPEQQAEALKRASERLRNNPDR